MYWFVQNPFVVNWNPFLIFGGKVQIRQLLKIFRVNKGAQLDGQLKHRGEPQDPVRVCWYRHICDSFSSLLNSYVNRFAEGSKVNSNPCYFGWVVLLRYKMLDESQSLCTCLHSFASITYLYHDLHLSLNTWIPIIIFLWSLLVMHCLPYLTFP